MTRLRLYRRLVGARVRSQLQYRASFALDALGMFLITFLDFGAILVIFSNVPELGGWSVAEVALLYGIGGIAFALTDMVDRSSRRALGVDPRRATSTSS